MSASASGLRHLMFGILTLLPVLGCSEAPPTTEEQTTTVESALSIGNLPTYYATSFGVVADVKMISKNSGYCFVTQMSGVFASWYDWVRVMAQSDGYCHLLAASSGVQASDGGRGVYGAARCITWKALNGGTVGKMIDSDWFSS